MSSSESVNPIGVDLLKYLSFDAMTFLIDFFKHRFRYALREDLLHLLLKPHFSFK